MMTTDPTVTRLVEVASAAARAAGEDVQARLQRERVIDVKGYRDIVTDADVAAQAIIVGMIRETFPDHGFLVEEEDPELPVAGPVVWIIDPIDGTTNYSRGVPVFCVSIAAVTTDASGTVRPLAAAVYDPLRDELFSAGYGQGSRLNGAPLQVSSTATVAEAVVALDFGHSDTVRTVSLVHAERLANDVTTLRAFGSAVLALAWVAAGRLDAYLNNALKPWDYAAGWLLIEEAGGMVTLLDGMARLDRGSSAGLGSNRTIHQALIATLAD